MTSTRTPPRRPASSAAAGTQDLADAEMFQGIEVYRHRPGVAEREQADRCGRSRRPTPASRLEPLRFHRHHHRHLLLVIRQATLVRAFVNLCRAHRATKVEWEASGNRRLFTCPTTPGAERDGARSNIRQDVGFPCVDKADHGNTCPASSATASCGPSSRLARRSTWPLYLPQPMLNRPVEPDAAVQERIDRFDNPFNWKLTIDGFLEGYHLRFLHAKTIGPYTVPDLCLHDEWGPHTRMTIVRKSFEAQEHLPAEQLDLPTCTIPVYILFPATILVWQNDHWELWTSFPDARDTTRSIARARLMAPDANSVDAQRALWDKNWRILMDTVEQEDWKAMEYLQEGLDAAPEHVVFGRNEPTLQHFHRTIERYTGEAAATR
ncbi:MAG: SRPBCC family protein [Acidimicrobiales bacterium]